MPSVSSFVNKFHIIQQIYTVPVQFVRGNQNTIYFFSFILCFNKSNKMPKHQRTIHFRIYGDRMGDTEEYGGMMKGMRINKTNNISRRR